MKNNFPIWVVKKILKEEKEKIDNRNNTDKNKHTIQTDVKFERKDKSHLLLLLYQGGKCFHLTKSLKRNLKSYLPSTVKANIGFTNKKLCTCFQIKDSLNITMILFTEKPLQKMTVQKIILEKAGTEFLKE